MSGVPYPDPQAIFYEQYGAARRDEMIGILLALFLGGFGVHHFYLGRTGVGILYCLFCWTPLPWVLGFIECFFMPARVREFNAIQAAGIAAALGISIPAGWGWPAPVGANLSYSGPASVTAFTLPLAGTLVACSRCHATNAPGARFCFSCGSAL